MTSRSENNNQNAVKTYMALGFIGAILVNAAFTGYLYGKLDNQVENNKVDIIQNQEAFKDVPSRLAKIETLLEELRDDLRKREGLRR